MFSRIKSQTQTSIVSLEQAKDQLNIIDRNDEDVHIQLLIDVATELAQSYTHRLLSTGVIELVVSGVKELILPYGEAINSAEAPITATVDGDPVSFSFDEVSQIFTFDDGVINQNDKVLITYQAGYADGKVPNSVKMGILMLVDSLYENRGDSVVGMSVDDIPLNSKAILNKVKLDSI